MSQPVTDSAYRIAIVPADGQVQASGDGRLVADSRQAMVMLETYLKPQVYFPRADVEMAALVASDFRTFCPFKGTARHWHVEGADGRLENAAWSYEKPLPEARDVGEYIAFDPNTIATALAAPQPATEVIGGNPLIHWLLREAWLCRTPAELTEQVAQRMVAIGVPLWRFNVNLWTLHPQIAGLRLNWMRDRAGVLESNTPHDALRQPAYLNSPVRYVSEGLGGVRQRLDTDDPDFTFPIMDELRAAGGTDYVAMPLPFSDGRFQTMTLATDDPAGFTTAQLGQVFEAVLALGRFYEVLTLRNNAEVLFDTYLGQRTGRQVLGGLTRRGDGETIDAAILFCDLRDSTVLAASLSREDYLALLNDFFERAVEPVLDRDGEVLKFIGDAVLAIFPLAGGEAAGACRNARAAADEIVARIAEAPTWPGVPPVQCGMGLHFGEVMYGNVGAAKRLDFTVIGTAANVAARLSDQSKVLNESLLISAEVAGYAPDGLRSLGKQELANVAEAMEVFVVTSDGD